MNYKANCMYINDVEFPLLPSDHPESYHDLDLDSYTNTKGYSIRQRVRWVRQGRGCFTGFSDVP